jgi:hypothetical protein
MKDITDKNFGVVIAFLLPGFMLLWGLSYSSPLISHWLETPNGGAASTVGDFLYATLASLALGLLISAIRWLLIDHFIYHVTYVKRANIDFSKLKEDGAFEVFEGVVENHYRYYQYYSNTLVAVVLSFLAFLKFGNEWPSTLTSTLVILLCFTLLLASRDCLKNYNERAAMIGS